MQSIILKKLGLIPYEEALKLQESLFNDNIAKKLAGSPTSNYLLFCEHPHVYTLGKSGKSENLLINEERLKKIGASFYKTNRGGDITYHGPGQLVGYPIFDLDKFQLSIKMFVHSIEESIIQLLKHYGINADRMEQATGVWLDKDIAAQARKICAIGIRASRGISMHGFALNVNTDLTFFNHINPCGFIDKGVTSIAKELHQETEMNTLMDLLYNFFKSVFPQEK